MPGSKPLGIASVGLWPISECFVEKCLAGLFLVEQFGIE